jgi:hypothetical protein
LAFAALGVTAYVAYSRRREAPIIAMGALPFGFHAMTVPPVGIFIRRDVLDNQQLLQHERTHWRQFQDRGLAGFYSDYMYQLATRGYDAMPMEQEARSNESEYCQANYTECVRTGIANTIQNPKFREI